MSNGATIKVFGTPCETRHRLSEGVRTAIQEMYARSAKFEQAKRSGQGLVEIATLLQNAREECLRAERAYDAHVNEHGCSERPKVAHAAA